MDKLISCVGLFVLLGIAFAFCPAAHRRHINLRVVIFGVALQLIFAVIILKTPVKAAFDWINVLVNVLLDFTLEGSKFVFGDLATSSKFGFIFAFQVLPTIIFFSSLMTVLYHMGVMQVIINWLSKIMTKTMQISGAESLSNAANIFLGQTEAPLLIKPYVSTMTRSELLAIMVGGMANTAGGILAAYVGMLRAGFPDIAGHLVAASVMSAPASFAIAKLMIPETEESMTGGSEVKITVEKIDANMIDAAARGASEGLTLALNVAAMLVAFIALIAMLNGGFKWVGGMVGLPWLSLEVIFGYCFAPIAWLMGVPAQDALSIGTLLGQKTVLNEFVAYSNLGKIVTESPELLSQRSIVIASYALSGFANFSSIAIQIGGIGSMAPERRGDLANLGLKAMIGGTLASFMTATIAGILI